MHGNLETMALGFAAARLEGWALAFIGSGPLQATLERLIAVNGLERTVFVGYRAPQDEVVQVLSSADFGIIPFLPFSQNLAVSTPAKLYEYIQARLPVLTTALPLISRWWTRTPTAAILTPSTPPRRRWHPPICGDHPPSHHRGAARAGRRRVSWQHEEATLTEVVDEATARRWNLPSSSRRATSERRWAELSEPRPVISLLHALRSPFGNTIGANVLLVVSGFATTVVLARLLGPAEKGTYDLVVATAALVALSFGFGLPTALTVLAARGRIGRRGALVANMSIAVLPGLAAVSMAHLLLPDTDAESLALLGLTAAALGLTSALRAIAQGLMRFGASNAIDVAGRFMFVLALLLATEIKGSRSANLALAVYAGTMSIMALGFAASSAPLWRVDRSTDFRSGLRVALPTYATTLVQFLVLRIDLFLVAYFLGTQAVGTYAVAVAVAQTVWVLSNAVNAVHLPMVANLPLRSAGLERLRSRAKRSQSRRSSPLVSPAPPSRLSL